MATTYRDLNLRAALNTKLKGAKPHDLQDIIEDAITSQEEKTLPGLGYLFELLWEKSDAKMRETMLKTISEALTTV
ncbi:MAG: small acid-soluble spore protein SspI [Candidatus Carbobacillus altaicus]|nr:small acid-soluble spore protein SspI [Candidatus Carbobacillus altaicus]